MKHDYDVIIIGGGPAGASAATLHADRGRKTLIVERPEFPRFHIGESLMPDAYGVFKRIGMERSTFEAKPFTRLKQLKYLSATGQIDDRFFWNY